MNTWSIGASPEGKLTVEVLSRSSKDKNFAYNSVDARISVRVGGFSGSFQAPLPFDELVRFKDRLATIYQTLEGTAEFSPIMEKQLELKVSMNKLGHYEVQGEMIDDIDSGSRLIFKLSGDQSDLNQTINDLDGVISKARESDAKYREQK